MNTHETISATELKQRIDAGESLALVETLAPEQFTRGHLPHAINIPTDEIEEEAPIRLRRNDTIVVYCASPECNASPKAAEKLAEMGYPKVIDFEGGKQAWQEAGFQLISS